MQKHEVVILIPCFNEEKTIIKICKQAKKFGNLMVIDDNSTDKTKILLSREKINFKSNEKNLGYEASMIEGFHQIIKRFKKAKYILSLDADGELPVKNIPKVFKVIKKKNFDLIVGRRIFFNRFSENILNFFFSLKYNLEDPISGFKLYKIKQLRKVMKHISKKMFLVDIIVKFRKLDLTMTNVDIITNKRNDNPRIGNSLKSNLKILNIARKIL